MYYVNGETPQMIIMFVCLSWLLPSLQAVDVFPLLLPTFLSRALVADFPPDLLQNALFKLVRVMKVMRGNRQKRSERKLGWRLCNWRPVVLQEWIWVYATSPRPWTGAVCWAGWRLPWSGASSHLHSAEAPVTNPGGVDVTVQPHGQNSSAEVS